MNCHLVLLAELLRTQLGPAWSATYPRLAEYCAARDDVLRTVGRFYGVKRAGVKQLFCALLNGGGTASWRSEWRARTLL